MASKTSAPVKWVVPGRRPAPVKAPAPALSAERRRLRTTALLVAVVCVLAAVVLRLARPEEPSFAPPPPLKPVRQVQDVDVYETENVRIEFKKPSADSEEPAEDVVEAESP